MLRPRRGDSCFLALPSEPAPQRKPWGGAEPPQSRRQQLGWGGVPMASLGRGGLLLVTPL